MTPARPNANAFLEAFLAAYAKARVAFDGDQWDEVWTSKRNLKWNSMMLRNSPPEPLEKTVMQEIADALHLDYLEGQPFYIDVVLMPRSGKRWYEFPLPIAVALEHEMDHRGFGQEVAKLLTVRSPLKVGITYCDETLERTRGWIREGYDLVRSYIGEAPDAEYLFIVGSEKPVREVTWYSMQFSGSASAAEIPQFAECPRQIGKRADTQ